MYKNTYIIRWSTCWHLAPGKRGAGGLMENDPLDAVKYPSNSLFFKVRIVPPRLFVLILIDDRTGPAFRIRHYRVQPVQKKMHYVYLK